MTTANDATPADLSAGVLHALRLKGLATCAAIANRLGLPPSDIEEVLRQGKDNGWYVQRTGRLSGWLLAPAGQQRWAEQHGAEKAAVDLNRLGARYDAHFLEVNGEFKRLCTDWQLGRGCDNTATELARIHQSISQQLVELTALVPRFARYRPRFEAAMRRFTDGEAGALLQPMTDSYHDIWLELHEDLLVLLDRQRDLDD